MPDGLGLFYVIVKTLFPPQDATEIDALLAEWEVTGRYRVWPIARCCCGMVTRMMWCPGETFRLQQALQREGLDGNLTCLWEAGFATVSRQRRWTRRWTFSDRIFKRAEF